MNVFPRIIALMSMVWIVPIHSNAQSTGFTYQGQLKEGALPATGAYDLRFTLYNVLVDGVALGAPLFVDDKTIADGLFTTELDFGAGVFDGSDRWIEIAVRPGSADNADRSGYVALSPRQQITPTPYAIRSRSAISASTADRATTSSVADTAGNADTVDGLHAADFAPVAHGHHLQDLAGILSDGQIPAGIARDSEVATGLATKADAAHSHDKTALNNAGALGFAWVDSEVADNLTIHSGIMDNTPIGTTLPTTAFFTHVGTNGNVVLGDAPADAVTVNGALKISSGTPGLNRVLTSDAVGNATWKTNNADTLDGLDSDAFQRHYQNMIVVAKSGGNFTTINDALSNTKDAAEGNRYLIFVAPGIYNERVTMKSYVDIQGSGEQTTKITQPGSPAMDTGTVVGADHSELRHLTVENTGNNTYAIGIHNDRVSPRILHVSVVVSGATTALYGIYSSSASPQIRHVAISIAREDADNYGIVNDNSSTPEIEDVTIDISQGYSGHVNYGIRSRSSSVVSIRNSTVNVSGASTNYAISNESPATLWNVVARATGTGYSHSYGVRNSAEVTMTNVIADVRGGDICRAVTGSGAVLGMTNVTASASLAGTTNRGIQLSSGSTATMDHVVSRASTSTGTYCMGIDNSESSFVANNCIFVGAGATNSYGVYNTATAGLHTVTLNNCQITGSSNTIRGDMEFTVRIGGSLLNGGAVSVGGGTCTCAGVYDENYAFYPGPACP